MTSVVHKSTFYAKLAFKETGETEHYIRKAHKKLREIEALKKKPTKTPEEWEKIHQEGDWLDIVKPINISIEPTTEEVKERKEKQREKTKMKKIEKQLYDEKQKHKREIELLKKQFQEQQLFKMKQLTDENRELKNEILKLKSKKSSPRQSSSSYYQGDEVSIEEKIEDEFHELYSELGSYRKVYLQMMRSYHPDKCTAAIAQPAAKFLGVLKQRYVN
jgi:hypothetical protein